MKREWQKPILEELEVSNTMLTTSGDRLDADHPAGTHVNDLTLS